MNTSRKKKTAINTIAGVIDKFSMAIFNFIIRTVFIHTLGMQYTGVSSVFTDILSVLSLSELGMSTAIATALYKPLHDKDEDMIKRLMKFYKTAYRFIAIFILVVGIIILPFLDFFITNVPDIRENIKIIFILYILKTSASYLLIYKTTLLSADQKQYLVVYRQFICSIIKYILEIIVLFIFKNFILYLVIDLLATVVQNYFVTKRAEKEYPYAFEKNDLELSKDDRKKIFKDIKGLSMYQISGTIGNSIDNLLISKFISTAISGVYSSYFLIRKQIESILKQFFSAVTPSIGNIVASGDIDKQYRIFNRVFYMSFMVVNFCAVSMFILFSPFIKMWIGDQYVLAESISFVISFDCFLYILLQAIASFRTANGLFIKGQYRPLIMSVLNIFLSILLIQKYGIFGTVLATIICRFVTQWYDPYLIFKYVFKKNFLKFYGKYIEYIAIFIVSCFVTRYCATIVSIDSNIFNFIYKLFCCIIIPNLVSVLFTFMTSDFKYFINLLNNKKKVKQNAI